METKTETRMTLKDMCPKETTISLSNGKIYKIKAYSLFHKVQMIHLYGEEELIKQFSQVWRDEFVSNLIYMLLDESGKKDFLIIDDFLQAVITPADYASLFLAAMQAIGYAEKVMLSKNEKKELETEKKTKLK